VRTSLVIPARNAAADLSACLAGVAACAPEAQLLEVIVVDDGSTDGTADTARAHGAHTLSLPPRGPAAARNAGARLTRGEIVVFLDADCVPQPGCLAALLAPFADPQVGGVRGRYSSDQRAVVARFTQLELEEKQARLAASREVAVVDTACCAYRRDLFWRYGGFDERYPATSSEDVDLSFRMVAGGERLVYAPAAQVRHRHPRGLQTYLRRKLRFGYFRARLYARHPQRVSGDGYTPRLMPLQIGLVGLLGGAALLSTRLAVARPLATASALAFLAASLPLARRAWAVDRPLAPLVPGLLLARSLAQGLGLAAGLASLLADHLRLRRRRAAP
jgi:glycosyltransferase involved in cell wall biosynthesis